VPPLGEVFNMAGMELPELLGKKMSDEAADADNSEEKIPAVEAERVEAE